MLKQTHISPITHFPKSRNKFILSAMRSAGFVLFLSNQLSGTSQGMEIIGTETQKFSQKELFSKRNEAPYTRDEVINILDTILDDEIKKDFLPFIEVFFTDEFPESKHPNFAVFRLWNNFFKKLETQKNMKTNADLHPQIQTLFGDLLCHHYATLEEKEPELFKIWMDKMLKSTV